MHSRSQVAAPLAPTARSAPARSGASEATATWRRAAAASARPRSSPVARAGLPTTTSTSNIPDGRSASAARTFSVSWAGVGAPEADQDALRWSPDRVSPAAPCCILRLEHAVPRTEQEAARGGDEVRVPVACVRAVPVLIRQQTAVVRPVREVVEHDDPLGIVGNRPLPGLVQAVVIDEDRRAGVRDDRPGEPRVRELVVHPPDVSGAAAVGVLIRSSSTTSNPRSLQHRHELGRTACDVRDGPAPVSEVRGQRQRPNDVTESDVAPGVGPDEHTIVGHRSGSDPFEQLEQQLRAHASRRACRCPGRATAGSRRSLNGPASPDAPLSTRHPSPSRTGRRRGTHSSRSCERVRRCSG